MAGKRNVIVKNTKTMLPRRRLPPEAFRGNDMSIAVIVPAIPPRAKNGLLARALKSVSLQRRLPEEIHVRIAHDHRSAAYQRDALLHQVTTEWLAPLDDDDEMFPEHLALLEKVAKETQADLVYPWFTVIGGTDPFPQFFDSKWNDAMPHQIPITMLVRTEVVRACGGWSQDFPDDAQVATDPYGHRAGEDYRLVLRLIDKGAKIVHLPMRTWAWHHDSGNTMGMPSRWS